MYLRSWDRFSKIFNLDIDRGKCPLAKSKVDESSISIGFVKTFLFGKKMAFYQSGGEWWVQYKNLRFNINDHRVYFNIKVDGLITVIVAHFDKRISTFIYTSLGLLISRRIDPTHDSWDEENLNFLTRLSQLRKDLKRD